jgi:hypothetical protein
MSYLNTVSSNVQTQINNINASVSPGVNSIYSVGLSGETLDMTKNFIRWAIGNATIYLPDSRTASFFEYTFIKNDPTTYFTQITFTVLPGSGDLNKIVAGNSGGFLTTLTTGNMHNIIKLHTDKSGRWMMNIQ